MKKRIIKDFNNLPEETREDIRKKYPGGYLNHIITFFGRDKQLISALPYETEEISYLIKMPSTIHLDEEESSTDNKIEEIPREESLEGIDEEKYLIQEEEEEETE
jgi:hypothetical protein